MNYRNQKTVNTLNFALDSTFFYLFCKAITLLQVLLKFFFLLLIVIMIVEAKAHMLKL